MFKWRYQKLQCHTEQTFIGRDFPIDTSFESYFIICLPYEGTAATTGIVTKVDHNNVDPLLNKCNKVKSAYVYVGDQLKNLKLSD